MARKTAGRRPRTLMLATASSLILSGLLLAGPASAQKAEPKAEKASAVAAVTWEDILDDQNTDKDVLMYGMGIKAQRYSGLDKINTKNVSLLKPRWSFSFGYEKQRGQEGQALVHDGVIYIIASYSRIFALDSKTGKKLWSFSARLPDDIRPCCDVVSRGAAIYNGKIYFGALDASMYALDAKTGNTNRHGS
jgi:glucose dehydrogenase